jgi:Na+/H+-dicarboxylate symporter
MKTWMRLLIGFIVGILVGVAWEPFGLSLAFYVAVCVLVAWFWPGIVRFVKRTTN